MFCLRTEPSTLQVVRVFTMILSWDGSCTTTTSILPSVMLIARSCLVSTRSSGLTDGPLFKRTFFASCHKLQSCAFTFDSRLCSFCAYCYFQIKMCLLLLPPHCMPCGYLLERLLVVTPTAMATNSHVTFSLYSNCDNKYDLEACFHHYIRWSGCWIWRVLLA